MIEIATKFNINMYMQNMQLEVVTLKFFSVNSMRN